MPQLAKPLPNYLKDRYKKWRAVGFEEDRAWLARLAEEGQRPRAMIIGCCDSRMDIVRMFGGEPGDLFVVRNVANIVPPCSPSHSHHGTSAAIEYACKVLKVANIVVIGHSNCGGVAACHDLLSGQSPELSEESSFIGNWVELLKPAYDRLPEGLEDRPERLELLEHEGVRNSLRNLETYPFVREALEKGDIALHGAWLSIAKGVLEGLDGVTREFHPV